MFRPSRSAVVGATLLTVLMCAGNALAQNPSSALSPSRVEIWGGWARAFPTSGGVLQMLYSPELQLGGTPLESRTTQTLTVDTDGGNGFDIGVNLFFTDVFGVQAAFTRSSTEVSGEAGDYDDYIRYISRPPPSYNPVENTYRRAYPGQDPVGTLTSTAFAVGGVVRWTGAQGRFGGSVAGGVHVDRYSGNVQNPVYTQFVLGGHSTLFPVHHRMVMVPEEGQNFWGPYVAADFHVRVARWLGIFAGIRGSFGSAITVFLVADDLVDPHEDTWTPEITDIQAVVGLQPLELSGTRWHFLAGAKVFVKR